MARRKIGIFGGTFNPIHVGHAIIANYVMQHCGLNQLWLMVSPLNPFKEQQGEHNDIHRLRMAEMVSHRIQGVETSAFEFQLPRPSYTIDTLHALEQKFPDVDFYLLIGADNWAAWHRWRGHDEIVRRFHVLIYPRRGFEVSIPPELQGRVSLVDAPIIEVASSSIRTAIAQMQNMSFYLPADVYDYILRHKLYM